MKRDISPINQFISETKRFYSILGPNSPNLILIDKYNPNNKFVTNNGNLIFNKLKTNNILFAQLNNKNNTTSLILTNSILRNVNHNYLKNNLGEIENKCISAITQNSIKVNINNENLIYDLVKSNLTSNLKDDEKETLIQIIVKLSKNIKPYKEIDLKSLQILKINSSLKSELRNKVLIQNGSSYIDMPKEILNPRIMLIDLDLTSTDIDKIIESGANVVINKKPIELEIARIFSKNSVLAVENTKKNDLDILSKALYKSIVLSSKFIKTDNVSVVKSLNITRINGKNHIEISGYANNKISTVLFKSEDDNTLEELELSFVDSIEKVNQVLNSGKIVKGAGIIENQIAKNSSKEIAKAFNVIPNLIKSENKTRIIDSEMSKIETIKIVFENLRVLLKTKEIIII